MNVRCRHAEKADGRRQKNEVEHRVFSLPLATAKPDPCPAVLPTRTHLDRFLVSRRAQLAVRTVGEVQISQSAMFTEAEIPVCHRTVGGPS